MQNTFLHNNIKFLRKQAGLTQENLAYDVCLSKSAIGHHEKKKQEPSLETLVKYSELFKVSLDELILKDLRTEAINKLNHHE